MEKEKFTKLTKVLTVKKVNYGAARAKAGVQMNGPIHPRSYVPITSQLSDQKIPTRQRKRIL